MIYSGPREKNATDMRSRRVILATIQHKNNNNNYNNKAVFLLVAHLCTHFFLLEFLTIAMYVWFVIGIYLTRVSRIQYYLRIT